MDWYKRRASVLCLVLVFAFVVSGCPLFQSKWHTLNTIAQTHKAHIADVKRDLQNPDVSEVRKTYLRKHVTPYLNMITYAHRAIAAHDEKKWDKLAEALNNIRMIAEKVSYDTHPLIRVLDVDTENFDIEAAREELEKLTGYTKHIKAGSPFPIP
jgi:uncharacterized lipoprotein YehR (DUF1307 family)